MTSQTLDQTPGPTLDQTLDPPPTRGRATSARSAAGWAGACYVAIFVLAMFANFLALDAVLQPGDATATADALREHEGMFRLGTTAFLGIFLADLVVAWALYVLFRPTHRDLALAAAWFRIAYTVVLGAALGLLYAALWLADAPAELSGGAADGGVLLALQTFDFTWVMGLAAFGVHLVLVARLLWMARGPRWIATLLALAGLGYALDTVAHIVLADYESYATVFLAILAVPSIVGELSLAGWLMLVALGRRTAPAQA